MTIIPLVYSCSGCSSAAQVANNVAIALDRRGVVEMSCAAGVGAGVPSMVKVSKSKRRILVLDGCALSCARKCLARHGVRPTVHYTLNCLGIKKEIHKDPRPADIDEVLEKILADLEKWFSISPNNH